MNRLPGTPRPSAPASSRWLLILAISLPGLTMAEIRMAATASPEQQLDRRNGAAVIGIANPNSNGLSHNRFEQFNVDRHGVVFNNSLTAGTSQLAGQLSGNAALTRTATAILAEVTGNQSSTLAGTLEVFGAKADVIVANPNGITLNGVRLLNTQGFVATTGVPDLTHTLHLEVRDSHAQVVVGAQGVDTRNLSYFDIVARTVALNGAVGAAGSTTDVQILSGLNRYDSQRRTHTVLESSGAVAPAVAISGGVAGAMHGRHIALISSESGVGVRHAGLIHAAQDIRIDAHGNIELTRVTAGRDMALHTTANLDTLGAGANAGLTAGGDMHLDADAITLGVATQSQRFNAQARSMTLNGSTLKTTASDPTRTALTIRVEEMNLLGTLTAYDEQSRSVSILRTHHGLLQTLIDSGRFSSDVSLVSNARIESYGGMDITSKRFNNSQGIIDNHGSRGLNLVSDTLKNQGLIRSDTLIDITTGTLHNPCIVNPIQDVCAGILSAGNMFIRAGTLSNEAGLSAAGDLAMLLNEGQHTNGISAEIWAGRDLVISRIAPGITTELINDGRIVATNNARLITSKFDNRWVVSAYNNLTLHAYSALVHSGWIMATNIDIASGSTRLSAQSNLTALHSIKLANSSGFVAEDQATVLGSSVTITSGTEIASGANIFAHGELVVRADGNLTNTGSMIGNAGVTMSSNQTFTNTSSGFIASSGVLSVSAIKDLINANGSVLSADTVKLDSRATILNDREAMIDGVVVAIDAAVLDNRADSYIFAWDRLQIHDRTIVRNSDGAIIEDGQNVTQAPPAALSL